MEKIHVLLASNFGLLRAGLHALLAECDNIEVSGESAAGPETIACAQASHPDVLILDVSREEQGTLAAIESLQRAVPALKIIALSATADNDFALRLLRAGVHGFLSEREAKSELVSAVTTVAEGQVFLCPSVSGALLSGYREQARARKRMTTADHC
jgi:two-component system response regulator NreC